MGVLLVGTGQKWVETVGLLNCVMSDPPEWFPFLHVAGANGSDFSQGNREAGPCGLSFLRRGRVSWLVKQPR